MVVGSQHHAPAALTPKKGTVPTVQRLGGPQNPSERVRKISPPPVFDHGTVQPMKSSCRLRYVGRKTSNIILHIIQGHYHHLATPIKLLQVVRSGHYTHCYSSALRAGDDAFYFNVLYLILGL
jgi:hypothetical protein